MCTCSGKAAGWGGCLGAKAVHLKPKFTPLLFVRIILICMLYTPGVLHIPSLHTQPWLCELKQGELHRKEGCKHTDAYEIVTVYV